MVMLDWEKLVGEAIAVRRDERLSQRDLAALANVSHPTVAKFEKALTSIRADSALAILVALGLAEKG
ncbi:MAG: helix-turn-helix transcriptional regulator [Proteobacteria bacterium]|nr:helix-turn-helix transcriptional regulator [Pseudomonadota bacterium]